MKKGEMASASLIMAIAGTILLFSCKKDHSNTSTGTSNTTDTTSFWDVAAGHYKVYDSVGEFIYEMDISHIAVDEFTDSLRFENFDGQFNFTSRQSYPNLYSNYIGIGGGDSLRDTNGNRWKLYGPSFLDYNNLHNDTINLRFEKTNINYWIEDAVPYYSCDCKQIAVKQH